MISNTNVNIIKVRKKKSNKRCARTSEEHYKNIMKDVKESLRIEKLTIILCENVIVEIARFSKLIYNAILIQTQQGVFVASDRLTLKFILRNME